MNIAIFGGSGYIGSYISKYFNDENSNIFIFDLEIPKTDNQSNIIYKKCDVRKEIYNQIDLDNIDWIFNLAAVHREPGHNKHEYFKTNILGAHNITKYANRVNCHNIYFMSSIAVYGKADKCDENEIEMPDTPYGISKLNAEYIHKIWNKSNKLNRLIICRPAVVYGPFDEGNIGRLIKAVRKGYFVFTDNKKIIKSYAYVYGLLDSIKYVIDIAEKEIVYNYCESENKNLSHLVNSIREEYKIKKLILNINIRFLKLIVSALKLLPLKTDINITRLNKLNKSTYVMPNYLMEKNYKNKYTFRNSLKHMASVEHDS